MGQAGRQLQLLPAGELADGAEGEARPGDTWPLACETGDRAALLPETARAIIAEAGRDGRLVNEIGALRVATDRLIAGVTDPARLATLLPPLINATVRAMQAQRALGGDDDGEFAQLVKRVLAMTNGEADGDGEEEPVDGGR